MGVTKEAALASARVREGLIALATALVVAIAIGGLATMIGDDDEPRDAAVTAPPPTEAMAQPETTPPAPANVPAPTLPSVDEPPTRPEDAVSLPEMGIPSVPFVWETADLPVDAREAWVDGLFEFDGRFWAVVSQPDDEMSVFTSPDGLAWEPADLPAGLGRGPARFWPTGSGLVAVSDQWDEIAQAPVARVFVAPDGAAWTAWDAAEVAGEDEHVWLTGAAGGDGMIVLIGAREPMPEVEGPPTVTVEHDGLVLVIDQTSGSYAITEDGALVSHGSIDQIWPQAGEGCSIYPPGAREPIFSAGWDALEQAALAAYEDTEWGQPLVVEVVGDDTTMTLDEYAGTVTVADPSGAVLYTGTEDELWRGPPPTFTDPRSGDVILTVPWEKWEAAHEEAYGSGEPRRPAPVILRSGDGGGSWTAVEVPEAGGTGHTYLIDVAWHAGRFVALGAIEDPSGAEMAAPQPLVLISSDGATWEAAAANLAASWPHGVIATGDGLLAIQGHEDGTQLVASPDGLAWEVVLSDADLDLPLGAVWFDRVSGGGIGTVVSGVWDAWESAQPQAVVTGKRGRTLSIAGAVYTVTDDATGAALAEFDEARFAHVESALDPADTGFKWGHGGLAVFDDAGRLVFAVSHRELGAAWEGEPHEPGIVYSHEAFIVIGDGTRWARVELADQLGADTWCAGLVAGTDRLVLATHTDVVRGEGLYETALAIWVGTPG